MTTLINQKLGLPEPFPSSPTRKPRYNLTIVRGDNLSSLPFCEKYALHRVLTDILHEREFKWTSSTSIETVDDDGSEPLRIKGDLETAIEYEPTAKEMQWEIPEPTATMIRRIRGDVAVEPDPETLPAPARPKRRAKVAGSRNEGKGRKFGKRTNPGAPAREGLVTISQIAAELGVAPAKARSCLRAAKEPLPGDKAQGWAWPTADVDRIKKLIKG